MIKTLLMSLCVACLIGCSVDSGDNEGTQTIFATPPVGITDETQSKPLVPQPDPVGTIAEPIVDEPEPDRVFDIFGPKFVESNVSDGERDVSIHLNNITLTFDEDVIKSNIQIHNTRKTSLRWKRIISGKKVVLTPLGNVIDLRTDQQYQISGDVEDAAGNTRAILITFTTVKGDKRAPQFIRSSVSHGDIQVNTNIERFVFTFDEDIHKADVKLWNDTRRIDMKWKMLIDGKRIILLKLPGEGLSLGQGELYTIQLRWSDAAGNWEPADWGIIRIITFTTEIKE